MAGWDRVTAATCRAAAGHGDKRVVRADGGASAAVITDPSGFRTADLPPHSMRVDDVHPVIIAIAAHAAIIIISFFISVFSFLVCCLFLLSAKSAGRKG